MPTYLHTKDAVEKEEGAANENDLSDGFNWGDQSFHSQLQFWGSLDHPGTHKNFKQMFVRTSTCTYRPKLTKIWWTHSIWTHAQNSKQTSMCAHKYIIYLSGRSVRSRRKTLRMPSMLFLPVLARETTMWTKDRITNEPSTTFQEDRQ